MGKSKLTDDRPLYLSSSEAKYSIGTNRGPFPPNDGSSQLEQVESMGGLSLENKELTFKEKVQRHHKRFFAVYCCGNIIFLAFMLPIIFLVITPAVAQLVVDKSDLFLVSAKVMEPRPDSVVLSLESKINLHVLLHVRTQPLNLQLFVSDIGPQYPWGNVTLPGQMIAGNYSMGIRNQLTPFENRTTWVQYVHQVVYQKEASLSVKGQVNAFIGVLRNHVHMQKSITSPTLNQFKGFYISNSTLIIPPRKDGTNLIGDVMLPNPSPMTLQIGDLVLKVMSGNLKIGTAKLENITLKPGNNTFPLAGTLDIITVFANLPQVIRSQANALKNGNLALNTVTESVTWNGTLVPYYTDVMKTLTLTAHVPVAQVLKNTINHLTHGGKLNLTQVVQSLPAGGLLGGGSGGGSKSSSNHSSRSIHSSRNLKIARALKENHAVRDALGQAFADQDPVKREAIIDTLAGL